jgi:hypothetical protein
VLGKLPLTSKLALIVRVSMDVAITKLIRKTNTISSEVILMALSFITKFARISVFE